MSKYSTEHMEDIKYRARALKGHACNQYHRKNKSELTHRIVYYIDFRTKKLVKKEQTELSASELFAMQWSGTGSI